MLFSNMAASFDIPTSSIQGCQFLHMSTSTCFLFSAAGFFLIVVILEILSDSSLQF
jgi:hypothetical protein